MEKTRFIDCLFLLEYVTIDLGADITDYFNYGFTEETWAQYSDRQRRLRAENNLARLNIGHVKFRQVDLYSLFEFFVFLASTDAKYDA